MRRRMKMHWKRVKRHSPAVDVFFFGGGSGPAAPAEGAVSSSDDDEDEVRSKQSG
jgi:hypothetical protein